MRTERISLAPKSGPLKTLSAIHDQPEEGGDERSAILLANGAGFDMEAPFMRDVAHGLVERGFPVMRFNYPYKEREQREGQRRPPDKTSVLESVHETARNELAQRSGERRILLAGKSLGARIASHLAAKDVPCAGLVFFGFPLHPARKPEARRSEHFPAIVQPALFLQGTRDALCDLELLRKALETFGGSATLDVVEGADHGFHVPKSVGLSDAEVIADLVQRVDRWEREAFPG